LGKYGLSTTFLSFEEGEREMKEGRKGKGKGKGKRKRREGKGREGEGGRAGGRERWWLVSLYREWRTGAAKRRGAKTGHGLQSSIDSVGRRLELGQSQ
jgi:hypothetical protein